jgi:hypothetical protein
MSFGPNGRKHRREPICYTGWLEGPSGRRVPCTVANIAQDGAQLCIGEAIVLPSRFTLWLTENGETKRDCRVIWRKADRLGVRFMPLAVEPTAEKVLLD